MGTESVDHYTAVLEVQAVTIIRNSSNTTATKTTDESARVVIRAKDMDELKAKLAAHIGLL